MSGWIMAGAPGAILGLLAAGFVIARREAFWRFVNELASCSMHLAVGEPELSAPRPVAEAAHPTAAGGPAFPQRAGSIA